MADEKETEEEPSIEEILDSIRQIISDDEEEEAVEAEAEPAEPEAAAEPEPAPEPEEPAPEPEPELVEAEPEAEPEPAAEPEPEPEEPDEEVIELTEPLDEPEPAEPETTAEPEPKAEPIIEEDDSLLTDTAQEAAYDGFSELARKTALQSGGITLEDIVRSELNPLLREWLDRHLPVIIDRLVREELERIAKRAETDNDGF